MISTKKNGNGIHLTRCTPLPQACPRLRNRNLIAFLLLATIILLIYSNVYECSWHFDDYNVIVENSKLHIDNLSPESLKQTFFARPAVNDLYRPLPMLTLAINWHLGHESLRGFHLVNNSIHLLTAFFLFLAIQSLLATPVGKERGPENKYFIALLATVLWAIHPIQTQAVTYIVQRMAAMAAMFYVLGIYLYLRARLEASFWRKAFFLTGCILSGCAAYLSKTNAVMFPFSLLLVEVVFFQSLSKYARRNFKKESVDRMDFNGGNSCFGDDRLFCML